MEIEVEGARFDVDVRRQGAWWRAVVNGRTLWVDARRVGGRMSLLTTGVPDGAAPRDARGRPLASHDVAIEPLGRGRFAVHVAGHVIAATVPRLARTARGALRGPAVGTTLVTAPMPGRIVKVLVAPGEPVRMRQPLIVIEAMKMENELRAPADAVVMEVPVREGTLVEARAVLAVLAPPAAGSDRQTEKS